MHKHAVQRLTDVSSGFRHTFRRCRSVTARPGKRQGSFPPHRQQEEDEDLPVAQELRNVLSPEACTWLEGTKIASKARVKGKKSSREQTIPLRALPPSAEKQLFEAMAPQAEAVLPTAGDDDALGDTTYRIPSGTLVEIRRSELAANGIILYSILMNGSWVVQALMSTGEIWSCHEHDVTFQFPQFISKQLAARCGMFQSPQSEPEAATRIEVLRKLRTFEKRVEYDCHLIPERARAISLYDVVAHPDPNTWRNITTREAAEMLLGKSSTLTVEDLFAVQSYLFAEGYHFVSEGRRFLQKPSFWARPRQDVADIQLVTNMVVRQDPALDAFVEKARKAISDSRRRTVESWNEAPSRRPLAGYEWTAQDRTIIRFLVASIQARRVIQKDPFAVPVAHILKRVGIYSAEDYDSAVTHTFLIDLGVCAPWEELNTRRAALREEPDSIELTPTPSTPILPSSLGPTDLYAEDVMESMRHDFGNMPVYVVDDWGAEELDDGISVERIPSDPDHTWLHVHIADPTVLLPPTHEFARQAMRATATQYYVDRTIPMLPRETGFHKFSLGGTPGQAEVVLTFSVKVNTTGGIVDYKIRPGIVRNVYTMKYEEVNTLLGIKYDVCRYPFEPNKVTPAAVDLTTISPTVAEDFQLIQQVTRKMGDWRMRNGALVFAFPRTNVTVEPRPFADTIMGTNEPHEFRGFPQVTYGVRAMIEVGSRAIVAECMKSAGRVASMFFRDRGIPALRRCVGPLQTELRGKIEELLASRDPNGIVHPMAAITARVTVPPGQYALSPGMHSLLGVPEGEGYVKVTSPLRRFGDILAHWQIKHALLAEKGERAKSVLFDEAWLQRAAEDIALRELLVKRVELNQQAFWAHSFLLRWMHDPERARREHDPLRSLKARVVEPSQLNMRMNYLQTLVFVEELALAGRVIGTPRDRPFKLGEELDVTLHEVALGTRPSLDFAYRGPL